jgi:hypothetical protein
VCVKTHCHDAKSLFYIFFLLMNCDKHFEFQGKLFCNLMIIRYKTTK